MPNEPISISHISIPPPPIPDGAKDFSDRVRGLLDGKVKDEATVARALEGMDAMMDAIAAGLYSLASMLVGEGEDSVRLVETAVANTEVAACHDPVEGRKSSRRALARAALQMIAQAVPQHSRLQLLLVVAALVLHAVTSYPVRAQSSHGTFWNLRHLTCRMPV